jgi:hypothetical protein
MHPYRCSACSHRFLAPEPSPRGLRGWISGAGVTVIAAALLTIALVVGEEGPEPEPVETLEPTEQPVTVTAEIRKAAEQGDAEAQFRVARNLLFEAMSDKRKGTEAVEWLQRAAENGSTEAMVHLGRMYRTGIGALQNYDLSGQWIERAAFAGDPEGMLELGRLYRDGIGFELNLILAYAWFNRAAAELSSEAAYERDTLARRLSPDQLKAAQDLSTALHEGDAALPGGSEAPH